MTYEKIALTWVVKAIINWRAWQIAKANGIAERKGFVQIDCDQPRYNLLFRMIEDDLIPMALTEGVGIICYNPLAGGMLTGRYKPGDAVQQGTRFGLQNAGPMYQERYWKDATFELLEEYRGWCADRGYDMTTTAVKWVTQQPGITSAIIGASRPEQLDASLRAASVPALSAEDLAWLDQLWYRLPRRKELR